MSVTDFFDPSELHALQFSRSTSACSVDLRKLFLATCCEWEIWDMKIWSTGGCMAEQGTWLRRSQNHGPLSDPIRQGWAQRPSLRPGHRQRSQLSLSPLKSWDFILYLYIDIYFAMTGIIIKIKENVVKWAKQVALIPSLALPLSF